jgi:hypothetical protein
MSADIRPEDWSVLDLIPAPTVCGMFGETICVECEVEALLISDAVDLCAHCRAGHPEMLLGYTPPHLRDLRPPWQRHGSLECFDGDGDYSIDLHRFHYQPGGPLWPCLQVNTARVADYENHTFEDHETDIWFKPDRASFRAAYQLARILRKTGRALIQEHVLNEHYYAIDVAPRHVVQVATKVVSYAEFLDDDPRCQICGCTEDRACPGGCSWANPQRTLCSRCLRGAMLLALESGVAL